MSTNPFHDPTNPLGKWEMPYEEFERPVDATISIATMNDGVLAMAAAARSPLGALAVLRIQFTNSATGKLTEVDVASTPDGMRAIGRMLRDTANAAANAAERAGR